MVSNQQLANSTQQSELKHFVIPTVINRARAYSKIVVIPTVVKRAGAFFSRRVDRRDLLFTKTSVSKNASKQRTVKAPLFAPLSF
jgi:hypothetical protein